MNEKYYNLIENLIKEHKRFLGNEEILDEIISDVYNKSAVVLDTIENEQVLVDYLNKVISTSLIVVPKRMNINNSKNARNSSLPVDLLNNLKKKEDVKIVSEIESPSLEYISKPEYDAETEIETEIESEFIPEQFNDSEYIDFDLIEKENSFIEEEITFDKEETIIEDEEFVETSSKLELDVDKNLVDLMINGVAEKSSDDLGNDVEDLSEIDEYISDITTEENVEILDENTEEIEALEESEEIEELDTSDEIFDENIEEIEAFEESEEIEELDTSDEIFDEDTEEIEAFEESEEIEELDTSDEIFDENTEEIEAFEESEEIEELDTSDEIFDENIEEIEALEESEEIEELDTSDEIFEVEDLDSSIEFLSENDEQLIVENQTPEDAIEKTFSLYDYFNFDSIQPDYDEENINEIIKAYDKKYPEKGVMLICNLKYNEKLTLSEIVERTGFEKVFVADVLYDIINKIKD